MVATIPKIIPIAAGAVPALWPLPAAKEGQLQYVAGKGKNRGKGVKDRKKGRTYRRGKEDKVGDMTRDEGEGKKIESSRAKVRM